MPGHTAVSPYRQKDTQSPGGHCWHGVSAGNLLSTPPGGLTRGRAELGTTELRCTLEQRVRLAWPLAGPPLTYFAQLGLWGVPLGVHRSLSSGFNVLYLFGADKLQ